MDLSNKSSASKLSAEVTTAYGNCEVTVVLVPTMEIASLMARYKNSILRYNPRSYLEFREQRTNENIRDSILLKSTGEFALLNNGITILSDDTYVNVRMGAQNRAQIELVNPQIINGGQTAFTLSRIFDETEEKERAKTFDGKEVVVRIITLPQLNEGNRKNLIFEISNATNAQTPVSTIDRTASNDLNRDIAERIFVETGLLYEPRRGEYSNAIYNQHVERIEVLERSLFTRLIMMATGKHSLALQKKMMRNTGGVIEDVPDETALDRLAKLYSLYVALAGEKREIYGDTLHTTLCMVVLGLELLESGIFDERHDPVEEAAAATRRQWQPFLIWSKQNLAHLSAKKWDPTFEGKRFGGTGWLRSSRFPDDAREFVAAIRDEIVASPNEAMGAV